MLTFRIRMKAKKEMGGFGKKKGAMAKMTNTEERKGYLFTYLNRFKISAEKSFSAWILIKYFFTQYVNKKIESSNVIEMKGCLLI